MLLSAEKRNEFDRAKNAKAIRVTLYELGIFIGALYLADKSGEIWPHVDRPYHLATEGLEVAFVPRTAAQPRRGRAASGSILKRGRSASGAALFVVG